MARKTKRFSLYYGQKINTTIDVYEHALMYKPRLIGFGTDSAFVGFIIGAKHGKIIGESVTNSNPEFEA